MTRAEKIQKRASRVGFDWQSFKPVLEKVEEELAELRAVLPVVLSDTPSALADREQGSEPVASPDAIEDELGDLLFSVTNIARHLKVDPEVALRKATGKFERRFRFVEDAVTSSGSSMELSTEAELDSLWQSAKQQYS